MDSEKYRHTVETLLKELHSPTTSNVRRHEIDQILLQFRQQADAPYSSLYLLENSSNHSTLLFSLGTLEIVINRKWPSLSEPNRLAIRKRLLAFLLALHDTNSAPAFIKKKTVKVIVDIGLVDWPQRYPDFFDTILKSISDASKASLGLSLGVALTDEFVSFKADLEMSRKMELNRLFVSQAPHLVGVVVDLLEGIGVAQQHTVAPTPPSSPQYLPFSGQPFGQANAPPSSLGPLDEKSEELCALGLECLANVFNCVPLHVAYKPNLIKTLFHFVGLGCLCGGGGGGGGVDGGGEASGGVGLSSLALGCVNELVTKKFVPQGCDVFVIQLLEEGFLVLKYIIEAEKQSGKFVAFLDERLLKKLLDFLLCFAENHLKRMESSANFPLEACLVVLRTFTHQLPQLDQFSSSLACWEVVIDFVDGKDEKELTMERRHYHEKYKGAILQFIDDVCRRLRVASLEYQTCDDNDEKDVEWTEVANQSFDLLVTVTNLYPSNALEMLTRLYSDQVGVFYSIESVITVGEEVSSLKSLGDKNKQMLHAALVGLVIDLQVLSSTANCFIGSQFFTYLNQVYSILESMCQLMNYSTTHHLYRLQASPDSQTLAVDLVNVHVHTLLAVQGFSHWMAQFYLESSRQKEHEDKLVALLLTILNSSLPVLSQEAPERLYKAAARVFASVAKTVRPHYLLDLEPVQRTLGNVVGGQMDRLPHEVLVLVYKALSDGLLLPWPDLSDAAQNWSGRSVEHGKLLNRLLTQFMHVCQSASADQGVTGFITKTLSILKGMLDSICHEAKHSKSVMYNSIQVVVEPALRLFHVYKNNMSVIDGVISFFHSLFDCLRTQLGPESIFHIVEIIMSLFSKEYMQQALLSDQRSGCQFTEKFLHLLRLLVQEPGSKFTAFSPKILDFCLQEILPVVSTLDHPGVKSELFSLFHEFFVIRWRYFFSGSSAGCEHESEFVTVVEAFRQCLTQTDVALVRQSLQLLDDLNRRCKLYEKEIFRENLFSGIVYTLLTVLVEKSHTLLQDELLAALFTLAAVDFLAFYNNLLPGFLIQIADLSDEQKRQLAEKITLEKDWPSFVKVIMAFANDIHYYVVCNTSSFPHST